MKQFDLSWQQQPLAITGKLWLPQDEPKASVCLIHGFGEHCGRYTHVAEKLNAAGFAVFAADLAGHGKSGGKRGFTPGKDLEFAFDTIDHLISEAKKRLPNNPVFIYAHSMGGNITANYLIKRGAGQIQAAVLTSPWFRLSFEPPAFKVALAKFARNWFPSFSEKSTMDTSKLSRDPAAVKAYEADELVHPYITPAYFFPIHEGGNFAIENASKIDIPIYLTHGTDDQVTSHRASQEFASNGGSNVHFEPVEGGYHELHNDIGKEKLLNTITAWLLNQLDAQNRLT